MDAFLPSMSVAGSRYPGVGNSQTRMTVSFAVVREISMK